MSPEETDAWETLLRSACDVLAGAPESLLTSVSVAGELHGVEGEALRLLSLSKQAAAKSGLEQVVEVTGRLFTARFRRLDLRRALSPQSKRSSRA